MFCDNILKKGGGEKLSDEAIEETLEKVSFSLCNPFDLCVLQVLISFIYYYYYFQVVKLLAFVSDKDLFGEFYR